MIPSLPHPASPASVALVVALTLGAGCGGSEGTEAGGPPRVVASIFPLGDLASSVAGDAVTVEVLLPPRASPSIFEPSPRQLRDLAGARAFLLVGGGLDAWLEQVPGTLDDAPVVRMNDGLSLHEGGGHGDVGTGDPHVWLDPVRVRDGWLPKLVSALAEARPDAAPQIEARGRALVDSLTALDQWMQTRLATVRGQAFVASHSAWGYLAERYGLREVGAIYAGPGREPSARSLADLVDRARDANVRAVFTEPQLGETGARALAQELGVPVRILDPLGGPGLPDRDGYLAMMRYNTEQIARALGAP